jgi:hypothetical protein
MSDSYRWEWRVFARQPAYSAMFTHRETENPAETDEIYILSLASPHNVKIRDGCLEIKVLLQTSPAGLQRWRPQASMRFPVDEETLNAAWRAWAIPAPIVTRMQCTREELLDEIVPQQPALRALTVTKRRTPIQIQGCAGEFVSLTILGERWESIAFESTDPVSILKAVRSIGLENAINISCPSALKRILGFGAIARPFPGNEE